MILSLISAVAQNGTIGKDGKLPWHYPTDLKYFKDTTRGKPVIMGRKTFEAEGMPKPLPGRRNIIVTRNPNYTTPYNIEIAGSLNEAIELCKDSEEVFVIGGSKLYEEAIEIVDKIYITLINKEYDGDTFFPRFDWHQFTVVEQKIIEENNTKLSFIEAIRI